MPPALTMRAFVVIPLAWGGCCGSPRLTTLRRALTAVMQLILPPAGCAEVMWLWKVISSIILMGW